MADRDSAIKRQSRTGQANLGMPCTAHQDAVEAGGDEGQGRLHHRLGENLALHLEVPHGERVLRGEAGIAHARLAPRCSKPCNAAAASAGPDCFQLHVAGVPHSSRQVGNRYMPPAVTFDRKPDRRPEA